VSNALEFQLFLGLPAEEIQLDGKDVEEYGLIAHTAGESMSDGEGRGKEFIGMTVGLSVSWDGMWSDEGSPEELEKIREQVVQGFEKLGVGKEPKLYWLANFS